MGHTSTWWFPQAVHLQRRWECYPTTSSEKSRFCCWAKCFFWPSQNHQVLIGFDFFPCKEKTPEGTVTIKADGAARSAQKIDSNPQPDKKPGPRRAETSRSHFQLAPLHYQLRPKVDGTDAGDCTSIGVHPTMQLRKVTPFTPPPLHLQVWPAYGMDGQSKLRAQAAPEIHARLALPHMQVQGG